MSFSIFDWAQEIIENAVFSFFFFIKFIKKKKKDFHHIAGKDYLLPRVTAH